MKQHHCLILFGAALAGCASVPPQLQPYPGIQRQIVDYYNAGNPSEEGFNCNQTEMEGVDQMQVTQRIADAARGRCSLLLSVDGLRREAPHRMRGVQHPVLHF